MTLGYSERTVNMTRREMTRREAREQAFFFLFEKIFNDSDIEDIVEQAMLARDIEVDQYAIKVFKGVSEHIEQIDNIIQKYSIGWKNSRIPKVTFSILRLAVYEMLYEDIPMSVSINEAVELIKIYAGTEDSSFANGILSSFFKDLTKQDEEAKEASEEQENDKI